VPELAQEDIPRLQELANFPHQTYRIEAGNELPIKYTFHSEMNQEVAVQPDGRLVSDRLKRPEVVVSISTFVDRFVYVGGEVGKPGTVPYRNGLTPLQAVVATGGFKDVARTDSVILVRAGKTENTFVSRKLNLTP
jgi:hypothetical protein